jgi:predicted metal-dependent hydrolase
MPGIIAFVMTPQIDKLVRSKRRTIALIVENDGSLTVRAPMRVSKADIESFVREQTNWILRKQEAMKAILELPKRQYTDGESFLFLGSSYDLKLVKPQRPSLKFANGFSLSVTARKRGEQLFTRWYKQRAQDIISDRVTTFAARYGFEPKRVKISSARTRWGSCSPDGTLNFTWRLVMASLDVIDYVVVHELSHLRVRNHSKRFWKVVESILPEYKHQRKWLKVHGGELTL